MEEMQIKIGMIFTDYSTHIRYRIISLQERQLVLCRMDCTKLDLIVMPLDALKQLLLQGEGELITEDQFVVVEQDNLTGALRETFLKKKAAVQQAEALFAPTYLGLLSKTPKAQITNICKNAGIGKTTFWKAIRIYLQSGLNINSLLDNRRTHGTNIQEYHTKTGRPAQDDVTSRLVITPDIEEQFEKGIAEYKSGRSQTLKNAYHFVLSTYYSEELYTEDGITFSLLPITERPTFRQFSYYASKVMKKDEIDVIKTSRREQRNNKRLLLSDSLKNVFGPGDCVEIDETEVDISLVSSANREDTVGRPILYFMVDVYTRAIVAFSVSFENNSTLGLINCLLNLSDDKNEICKRYGMETGEDAWIPAFLPKRIRCDRGSEYRGKQAERIFAELGITRELVTPATGSLKGVVEHMFHQFHQDINPHTEGYGQIQKRHDSKHHQQATLDINDFTAMVIAFVHKHNQSYMEQYPRTKEMYSENVNPIPLDLWQYGVRKHGNPRPIGNPDQFLYSLMIPVTAKVSREGLTWKGLHYLNILDPHLRELMYSAGRNREAFEARMDPHSVDTLYYLHREKLMRAHLNPDKTGNADFAGMTMKEYESFYCEKKKQDKLGRERNLQIDVAAASVYHEIVLEGNSIKCNPANTNNLIENRREERFLINAENAMENRLPEPASSIQPESSNDVIPTASPFAIDLMNPDAPDFWAVADCAARAEEKKKLERLRNEGANKC